METLTNSWAFLQAALGPLTPFYVLGFFGTFMVLMSAPLAFKKKPDPLNRLKGSAVSGFASGQQPGKNQPASLRYSSGSQTMERWSQKMAPTNQKEFGETRLKLVQAGYRAKSAVGTYHLARFVLGVGLLAFGTLFVFIRSGEPSLVTIVLSVLVPGLLGYFLPNYWIERRRQLRQEDVTNGFPDALDLMLVCVEAGQSLDQAILRVASEVQSAYPTLAEEFEIVSNEMRAGKDRVTVLRDMAERCGVSDVSAFVTVLIQSATFGTSISDALRVYASEMRDKRVMRAEEKANLLPTKLTLGTMMFTVPPLLIILIGPSVYEIATSLGSL
jgi:tight adherence protein C